MTWRKVWLLALWAMLAVTGPVGAEDPPATGETPSAAEALAEKLKTSDMKPAYRAVPPAPGPETGLPPGTTEATVAEAAKQPQLTADTKVTWDAFTTAHDSLGGKSPQQVFNEFSHMMNEAARNGEHGTALLPTLTEGEWADRLIQATTITQNAAGDNSPKTIKTLIKNGAVNADQAALMWFARDTLVKRTLKPVLAKLKADHPHLTFDITILDSGSFGSLGSDIDKTMHLTARDAEGKQVATFGEGGQVMGGDIKSFISLVYKEFDAIGTSMGATHSIAKSLDTEFFPSDTLTPGLGRGATHADFHSAFEHTVARLDAHFAALQRNAGPSYQTAASVTAQVLGRTVAQDVALQDKRAELAELRARFDTLSPEQQRRLVLDEALVAAHSPATVATLDADGNVTVQTIDVVEFLERNGLAVSYEPFSAVGNAVGNHEKYIHKAVKVWSDEQVFLRKKYEEYLYDFAKYGDRGIKDLAMVALPDHGPDKAAGFGQFARAFTAEGSGVGRAYTREVHDQIFRHALGVQYDRLGLTGAERTAQMARDLDLYWAVNKANERLLQLKANPDSAASMGSTLDFPYDKVFAELLSIVDRDHAAKLGADFADLAPAEQLQRRITAAMELHVVEAERSVIVLTAGHLEKALDVWLGGSSKKEAARIRILDIKRRRQLQNELGRLMAAHPPRDPAAAKRHQEAIENLKRRVADMDASVERRRQNPGAAEGELVAANYHMAKRLYTLYYHNEPDAWRQMTENLSPEIKQRLDLAIEVWEGTSTAAREAEFQRSIGVDPDALPPLNAAMMRQLAVEYAKSLGFDMDAYFAPPAGTADRPNSPGNVLKRYFVQTYVSVGGANSALGMLRQMQLAADQPYEKRMKLVGDALVTELVGGIPVGGKVYTTYLAWRGGDAMQTAGGVVDLAGDLMQMYLGVAGGALDQQLINQGMLTRLALLDGLGKLGGHAAMYLTMARTAVELYGHEAFAPIKDHFFQLVMKGYVDVQPAGFFFRVGSTKVDSRIPVTPIIEPQGHTIEFLYLKPEWAQKIYDDLRADGKDAAAVAILHLLDYDENMDSKIDQAVMIDLKTDFAALIARVEAAEIDAETPPKLRDQMQMAKQRVTGFYRGQAALQDAIRQRIRADRELRRAVPDHLNLWVIASRENLGLALDAAFQRETELLYRSLWGMDEARETLAADSTKAWEMWKANAPSHESEDKIRQQFLAVFSPRKVFEAKQTALRASGEELAGVPWGAPSTMLAEYLSRQSLAWAGWERPEDTERRRKLAAIEHQAAGMAAFRNNSYMNARTPTQPYRLDEAMAWFSSEITEWQGFVRSLPQRELRPGQTKAQLRAQATARLEAMRSEVSVLATGYHLAEEAVAPKIAQLHLMHWLAGEAPFDNDVHVGVKFVWHDAETQARIREKLVADLVRGRKLIPTYRAQASSYQTLYEAEVMSLIAAYSHRSRAATNMAIAAAADIMESRGDARTSTPAMPGEITLTADPYLVKTRDGKLEVAANIRVDHDNLRAETVETKVGTHIVPFDKLDKLPAAEVERALKLSAIERDNVLCIVVVDIAVTKATPAKGHEDEAYTTLPKQTWYLVVPGAPPEAVEDRTVNQMVFPLKNQTSGEVGNANAHEHVDLTAKTVYAGERLYAWFNIPPQVTMHDFHVAIRRPDGEIAGQYLNQHILGLPGDLETGEGAPGDYCIPFWGKKIDTAGTYTIEIRPTRMSSIVGTDDDGENKAPWTVASRVELSSIQLVLKGVTAENGQKTVAKPQLRGTLALKAEGSPDTPVRLTLTGRWQHLKDGKAEGPQQKSIGIFTLALPKSINLQSETRRAAAQYALVSQAAGKVGTKDAPVNAIVFNGWFLHGAPNPKMIGTFSGVSNWISVQNPAQLPHYTESGATDVVSYTGDTFRRVSALDEAARARFYGRVPGPAEHGVMRLTWSSATSVTGEPKMSLAWHHRSGKAHLYIPIRMQIEGLGEMHAYAVYGFEAGAYDGPAAEGGGDGTGDDAVADADGDGNGDGDDGAAGTDAAGDGAGNGNGPGGGANGGNGDGIGDATAGGPNGGGQDGIGPNGDLPRDPNQIDPNHPDVAPLIREWIRVAEPPPNATIGAQFRFTPYGLYEGRSPTGIITINAPPDDSAGLTPEAYCWRRRDKIDSVNHCTIGEWVMARLSGETSNCQGRYKPLPPDATIRVVDFTGQSYGAARNAAMTAGLRVQPVAGAPATTKDGEGKVLSQTPAAGAEAKPGATVKLVVAAPHVPTAKVPHVIGLTAAEARAALRDAGFRETIVAGGAPPNARLSELVQAQDPAPGAAAAPGTPVRVTVYAKHVPKLTMPDLRGMPADDAEDAIRDLQLRLTRRRGPEAPAAERADTVQAQTPAPGTAVDLGDVVTLTVYGRYTPPIVVPDVVGMTEQQAADALTRAGLRGLRRQGPEAPTANAARTVQSQTPAAGTRVERDTAVTATVYGDYVPPHTVPDMRGMTLQQADAALKQAGLPGVREDGPAAPNANAANTVQRQTPAGGTRVEPGTRVTITMYGDYQPPLTVPDMRGMTLQQADAALKRAGLPGVREDGPAAPNANAANTVQRQTPAGGTRVEPGTRVTITMYGDYVPPLTVPNLVGMTEAQAAGALQRAGLQGVRRQGPAAPTANAANTVQQQAPAPGTRVERGAKVEVLMYGTFEQWLRMPKLAGMHKDAAVKRVRDMGLVPEVVYDGVARNANETDKVFSQFPVPGARIGAGEGVQIVVRRPGGGGNPVQPVPPAADGTTFYVVIDIFTIAMDDPTLPTPEHTNAQIRQWARTANVKRSELRLFFTVTGDALKVYNRAHFAADAMIACPITLETPEMEENGRRYKFVGPVLAKVVGTASTREELKRLYGRGDKDFADMEKTPLVFRTADGATSIADQGARLEVRRLRNGWSAADREEAVMVWVQLARAFFQ